MRIENKDMPAMPLNGDAYHDFERAVNYQDASYNPECQGLTKREYFAAMAMQGFCSTGNYANGQDVAYDAVRVADALLEELAK